MNRLSTSLCFAALTLAVCVSTVSWAQQNADRWTRMDANNDGKVTKDEFPAQFRNRFDQMDANADGNVSQDEFNAARGGGNDARKNRAKVATPKKAAPRATARSPAPTHADVSYGDHEKQAFDIWLAESKDGKPTPLVIYIHGGGFRGGDKNAGGQPVQGYLDRGISFASMNYRLSDVGPYPIMHHDAARGLQYIRSKAKEWNLDAERVACYGGSAGAGISLWLAFHDDLADRDSDDPVARQSTRIVAAGTSGGQSTYDMRTFREWFGVPNLKPVGALVRFYAVENDADWESDRVKKLMTDASAINHLTKDDAPVFMTYGAGDVPVDENTAEGVWVHHARLGIKLKEAMDALGLECHVTWRDHPDSQYADVHAFLRDKIGAAPAKAGPAARQRSKGSAGAGRIKPNGEFYAAPAMQEMVPSPIRVGDRAPAFSLRTTDADAPISLAQFTGKKPVVLVFGSITCAPFRQKVLEVFDIHKRYADRAEFLMMYIREAHPESTILFPQEGGPSILRKFEQTDSLEARIGNAQSCTALLQVPFPVLIDAEDNGTLGAYGGWPNRLVVVDTDGIVAWDSGQGPAGFQPPKLEAWLRKNL